MRAILGAIATALRAAATAARQPAADAAGVECFEKRVRPLLAEHCYPCHGPDKRRGGLTLNSPAAVRKGGDRGPAVVPGRPDESLLIKAVRYADGELRMPPKGKLT